MMPQATSVVVSNQGKKLYLQYRLSLLVTDSQYDCTVSANVDLHIASTAVARELPLASVSDVKKDAPGQYRRRHGNTPSHSTCYADVGSHAGASRRSTARLGRVTVSRLTLWICLSLQVAGCDGAPSRNIPGSNFPACMS